MKKLLLLIALLLPALFVTAQGIKNGLKEEPKINVGIKGGFNSSMYFTSRLELDGERMEDVQNNYKVGYFAAMFFRVHMKRHFIQPGIMYNIYKGEIAFNKNQNKENTLPELAASIKLCVSPTLIAIFPFLLNSNNKNKKPLLENEKLLIFSNEYFSLNSFSVLLYSSLLLRIFKDISSLICKFCILLYCKILSLYIFTFLYYIRFPI